MINNIPNNYTMHQGYMMVKMNNHPYKWKNGYVKLHRLIMENKVGRYLKPHEIVHHKDGNKLNNSIDNLIIITRAEHRSIHNIQDKEYEYKFDINMIKKIYLEGYSCRDIAKKINAGKSTIAKYIKELGISRQNMSSRDSYGMFIKRSC